MLTRVKGQRATGDHIGYILGLHIFQKGRNQFRVIAFKVFSHLLWEDGEMREMRESIAQEPLSIFMRSLNLPLSVPPITSPIA